MNEVMILRRGGGSVASGGVVFGAIETEYPSGSACTCTGKNSGKVLRTKDTSGKAFFAVPSADTWKVEADKKSRDVAISDAERYKKIKLSLGTAYFDGGNACDYSGGWDSHLAVGETIKLKTDPSESYDIVLSGTAAEEINLEAVDKLIITVPKRSNCKNAFFYFASVAGGNLVVTDLPSLIEKWELAEGANEINVADYDSSYYFGFCIVTAAGGVGSAELEVSSITAE